MGIEAIPEFAGAVEAIAGSKVTQDVCANLLEHGTKASESLANEAWAIPGVPSVKIFSARSFFVNPQQEGDAFAGISEFSGIGEHNADGYLPAGVHRADWDEFSGKLGFNDHRQQLLKGLKPMLTELHGLGLRDVYVGGSFVTSKLRPGDVDLVAPLKLADAGPLWHRVTDLQVGSDFGQDLKISHANQGLNSTNMKLMRFNMRPSTPKYELGIVHLDVPKALAV